MKPLNPKKVALLKNRLKQGGLAALGCLAVLGATFIRVAVNRGDKLDATRALEYSLKLSAGAGLAWSLFPRAEEPLAQSWDSIKTEVNNVTRMAAQQALPTTPPAPQQSYSRSTAYEGYPSMASPERRAAVDRESFYDRHFTLDDSMFDVHRRR